MSGMTGYDQTASYSTSQYNYVPNLSTTGPLGLGAPGQNGGPHTDPRYAH